MSSTVVTLREIIAEIESGSRPKGGIIDGQGAVFSLGAEHLTDKGGFDLRNKRLVDRDYYDQMRRGKVKPCDILIVKDGATTGKVSFVAASFPYWPCCTNEHLFRLSVNTDLADPKYIFYYLCSPKGNGEILQDFRGATVGGISQEFVDLVKLPLPTLIDQRRVATILERADRLRRLRRFALELGEGYLQSVFLEMFGSPLTNPKKWAVHALGEHLAFMTSGSRGWAEHYAASGARFIRSLDVRMNYLSDSDAVFVHPPRGAEALRTRVQPADVLLTITGSRIGRVAPVPRFIGEAYISQHVALLRLVDSIDAIFLSMFLSLDSGGQRQIALEQYGQTKPGLNLEQIRSFSIPFPPQQLQGDFASIAKRYKRFRAQQREALRQAEHLFQTLLHQAFHGEL